MSWLVLLPSCVQGADWDSSSAGTMPHSTERLHAHTYGHCSVCHAAHHACLVCLPSRNGRARTLAARLPLPNC